MNGTNGPSQAVTWTATNGSVTAGGTYTATAGSGPAVVTARSVQDPTQTGFDTVTVSPPIGLAVTPSATTPVGSPVTVTASGGSGTYIWVAPGSTTATVSGPGNGTLVVGYDTPGTYPVTVTDTNGANKTVNITVVGPTCTFTASPSSIVVPQTTTLTWSCQNTISCKIGGSIVNPSAGTLTVAPTNTTTYTITCTGAGSGVANTFSTTATVKIATGIIEGPPQ